MQFLPFSSISSNCGLAASLPPLFLVGVDGVDGDLTSSDSTDSLRLSRVTVELSMYSFNDRGYIRNQEFIIWLYIIRPMMSKTVLLVFAMLI